MSKKFFCTVRYQARRKGLRFYDDAKPCEQGHYPSLKFTRTGKCIQCDKEHLSNNPEQMDKERQEIQQQRLASHTPTAPSVRCFYWFTYPDGDEGLYGPFDTQYEAVRSYRLRWSAYYGYSNPNINTYDFRY